MDQQERKCRASRVGGVVISADGRLGSRCTRVRVSYLYKQHVAIQNPYLGVVSCCSILLHHVRRELGQLLGFLRDDVFDEELREHACERVSISTAHLRARKITHRVRQAPCPRTPY